ncbi:MAG: type VII secretion protein EssB/YukC, partial [Erysipelotrichaceae bacterium]
KSDLNAKDNYDYSLLTKKEEHLLNCELKKEDEEVKFIFDLLNYKDCNYIKELEEIDKYRFLYNLLDLYSI